MIHFDSFNNFSFLQKYKKEKQKINKNEVNNVFIISNDISNDIPDKIIIKGNDMLLSFLCPPENLVYKYIGLCAELYFDKANQLSVYEYNCLKEEICKKYLKEYNLFLEKNEEQILFNIKHILSKNNNNLYLYTSTNEMPFNISNTLINFITKRINKGDYNDTQLSFCF